MPTVCQLRTLQRRVKQRQLMAKKLVYTCLDDRDVEAKVIGPKQLSGGQPLVVIHKSV